MNKIILALVLGLVIVFSFVAFVVLFGLPIEEVEEDKLYTFLLLVGENTYTVSVLSNYSSTPEVSYFGLLRSVSVYFRGEQESAYCNITIPKDLIWGDISVNQHGFELNTDSYIHSSNSTHISVYFVFDLPAYTKDFVIMGTEGVST
jgi:hypothetical protein